MRKKLIHKEFDSLSNKRVSYILTTRNRAELLEKCLISMKSLLKKNDELIVIDGNSTDDSLKVIQKYKSIVSICLSEKDSNHIQAFNKGILLSQGRYVKEMFDDDVIHPREMERAVKVLDKNTDIDLLVCGGTKSVVGEDKIVFAYVPPGVKYGIRTENPIIYKSCGTGFLIRKRAFANVGFFPMDEDAWIADTAFAVKCIAAGLVVKFLRINLYHHYIYKHSVIFSKQSLAEKKRYELVRRYTERSFYLSYLYKRKYRDNRLLIWAIFSLEYYLQKCLKAFLKIDINVFKNPVKEKIVWDGGLS